MMSPKQSARVLAKALRRSRRHWTRGLQTHQGKPVARPPWMTRYKMYSAVYTEAP